MRTPSINTLSAIFGDNAKEAKRVLTLKKTGGNLTEYASVVALRDQSYSRPSQNTIKLTALNELGGFYGIGSGETCAEYPDTEYFEYLNTGDCYAITLILWRGNFRVSTVGDFIETQERNGTRLK